tara:strand:- start:175 stop:996 length:822 start_codon:yes stop_codon:yes gene_type:complete
MPEGPEIRRAADKIARVLEGRQIEVIHFGLDRLKGRECDFQGAMVRNIETRGKALLTHFDNDLTIYSHNQLYGRWYTVKRDAFPQTNRSLRLALHTKTHSALLYSASDISIWDQFELELHPFLAKIGPDILNPKLGWKEISLRLRSERFQRRALASLYLAQDFLAGIGNYLRSEILFDAKVIPDARPRDLSVKQLNDLGRSTLKISQRAYETAGITNPPRLVASLKKQGLKRREFRHAVFGRQSQTCYECGETIRKDLLSGRRLYWCPGCQGG